MSEGRSRPLSCRCLLHRFLIVEEDASAMRQRAQHGVDLPRAVVPSAEELIETILAPPTNDSLLGRRDRGKAVAPAAPGPSHTSARGARESRCLRRAAFPSIVARRSLSGSGDSAALRDRLEDGGWDYSSGGAMGLGQAAEEAVADPRDRRGQPEERPSVSDAGVRPATRPISVKSQ